MVNQYSGYRRNPMCNNNKRNPPPATMNQYSGNQRNPMYNSNTRNPPPATVNQYSGNQRNPMNNNNTRNPPPAMVNQYSSNPRNRLAAPAAFNHNLQYPNSRSNIWRSNYRRNRLSNNRFTRNRILRQSFYRTNWVHCCNEINHFDGRRSRNSRPDTRVINHANRNNPRHLHGTRDCGRFNHFEGRRFRNSQPYSRDLIRSDRNNPRWLDERERYYNSTQNNNSDLFHNITEHDMGQQPQNLAQDGYNESDPQPERYLEEDCVDFNNDIPEEDAGYAQDGYNESDPMPERLYHAEDCVNFNGDVPEEGAEYAHADRNCRDPPLRNDNIAEEDLAANRISNNGHRQEIQGDLTEEQEIPTIDDLPSLDNQTPAEVITQQSEQQTELVESEGPILRIFRPRNPNSSDLFICYPINEDQFIPMGRVRGWRLASLLDENATDGLTEDNEEEADEMQENAGLSEEEISEKLQIGKHSESANEGKMETDGLTEEQPAICVLCQFEYEKEETTRSFQCGHECHAECMKEWLLLTNKCPVCFGNV